MANDEKSNDVLSKVARTVGTALGTVTSAASEIVGGKEEKAQPAKQTKTSRRQAAPKNEMQARQRERMKAKRAKHRRKLHRKTKG